MEFSSEAGRSTLLPNTKGNSSVHTSARTHTHTSSHSSTDTQMTAEYEKTKPCPFVHIYTYISSFFYCSFLFPLSASHGTFRAWTPESASLDTQLLNIQPYAPISCLSSHLKLPPSSSLSRSILTLLPAQSAATAASALCAPLSLRGSPLIALHITLNHHNNKSTLSPTNHLEGPALKILR